MADHGREAAGTLGAALIWAIGTFAFFIGLDKPGQGVGYSWFEAAVLLRDAALVLLAVLVIREMLRPDRDVVRRDGDDDPAGGPLDGAPDRHDPLSLADTPTAWSPAPS